MDILTAADGGDQVSASNGGRVTILSLCMSFGCQSEYIMNDWHHNHTSRISINFPSFIQLWEIDGNIPRPFFKSKGTGVNHHSYNCGETHTGILLHCQK